MYSDKEKNFIAGIGFGLFLAFLFLSGVLVGILI